MKDEFRYKIEDLLWGKNAANIDLAFQLMKGNNCSIRDIAIIWSDNPYQIFAETHYNPTEKRAYFIPSKNLLAMD